jgi:choline monooxygenase
MRTLSEFLTDEDRTAIGAPISEARTFPQIAYRSQEFFEFEVAHLFSRNWVAAGFAGSLPHVGDVAPFEIFGIPLLMTRAEDKAIRVFHNIGAHDGCPIALTRQSRMTTLEGPYHGWQYNLRGELVKVPFWDGTPNPDPSPLRRQSADLKEIRSGIWNDIIFIDLSGKCPTLPVFLSPLIELFEDFDFSTLEMANDSGDGEGIHRFLAKANWKPLWENYAPNVYHEGFVHEQYRRSAHVPRVDYLALNTYR